MRPNRTFVAPKGHPPCHTVSALSTLQPRCAACTLDHTCPPPFDMGMMWSNDLERSSGHEISGSIGSWQIPQIQPSRSKTLIELIGSYATPYFRARFRWFLASPFFAYLFPHTREQKSRALPFWNVWVIVAPHCLHSRSSTATDLDLLSHLREHSTEHVRPRLLSRVTYDLPHSRQ